MSCRLVPVVAVLVLALSACGGGRGPAATPESVDPIDVPKVAFPPHGEPPGSGVSDPSFGTDGIATVAFGGDAHAWDMTSSGDRIVAVGGTSEPGSDARFAVARVGTAGALDPTFSGDGRQTFAFGGFSDLATEVYALDDGRLLVGGSIDVGNGASDVAVIRTLADGTLDPSFGDDGVVVVDPSGSGDFARAMAYAGNKIFVGGTANGVPFVARLTAEGTLDPSFGTGGIARMLLGAEGGEITDLAISAADGSIYASVSPGFHVLRFLADGSADTSFGLGGWSSADAEEASAVTVQPGLGIVVAGSAREGGVVVARFRFDGTLDPAFGGAMGHEGVLVLRSGLTRAADLTKAGGDLALCATHRDPSGDALAAVLLSPEGEVRRGFGTDGVAMVDAGEYEVAQAIELTPAGQLVVGGWIRHDGRDVFVLWRLLPID